jgi:uncharacterized membrane protein
MSEKKPNPVSNLSTFRIETLEDGVFAIAMTLLVLNLKVPDTLDTDLKDAIIQIWPNLFTFFVSFIILGVFWFGHRAAMHYVKHADHVYHWLNLILLMFVSILPFSASLLAKYYNEQTGIILYGLNLVAIGVTLSAQWAYASRHYRLIDTQLPSHIIKFASLRSRFAPFAYSIAIALSFINLKISLAIYTIVPILYIIPVFQPLWRKISSSRKKYSK